MSTADYAESRRQGRHTRGYVALVYAVVLIWGVGDLLSTYYAYAATGSSAGELILSAVTSWNDSVPRGAEMFHGLTADSINPFVAAMLSAHPLLLAVVKAAIILWVGVVLLVFRTSIEEMTG
jgi:hypothetical protein